MMFAKTIKNQSGRAGRLFGILMVTALLAASIPQIAFAAPAPAASVTCVKYHNVVSGETLSGISVLYDISIAELAAANNLTEPYTLVIDQRLCIPGSATSTSGTTSTTSTSTKPVVTIERDGKFLLITVANFPTKGNYYVKIKKGHLSTDTPWVKIGILRTKKNTEVTRAFRLPSNFYEPALIMVCLKNAKSDALLCTPFSE